jgi:hypothetical protein
MYEEMRNSLSILYFQQTFPFGFSPLATTSRPALWPTHPPIQWILGILSWSSQFSDWLDDLIIEVQFPAGAGNVSPHHRVKTGSGAHPASYPFSIGTLSLGAKRPGRDWCLVKHRDNFTFQSGQCVKLTTHHLHLVPWLRMSGAILPIPNTS